MVRLPVLYRVGQVITAWLGPIRDGACTSREFPQQISASFKMQWKVMSKFSRPWPRNDVGFFVDRPILSSWGRPTEYVFPYLNKKAQLTQGLRATAPSFQDGRQLPSWIYRTGNRAIRSADPENPSIEPNMEWIGCTVCEIFAFKLYCDLETGVRGHSRSSKAALFDTAHTTLFVFHSNHASI